MLEWQLAVNAGYLSEGTVGIVSDGVGFTGLSGVVAIRLPAAFTSCVGFTVPTTFLLCEEVK